MGCAMNTVTIKINGVEYNLKGRENENYLIKISNYVDGKVRDITNANRKLSTTAAATLASLNIADELFKADIEIENLIKKNSTLEEKNLSLEQRIKELEEEIEKNNFSHLRITESLNKELEDLKKSRIEDYEKKIDILKAQVGSLEKEKEELIQNNNMFKEKEVELVEELSALNERFKMIEEEYKKINNEKEALKAQNKDIKFQLQTSKYKVLDLEKKLIDSQIELAKAKKLSNPLIKEV